MKLIYLSHWRFPSEKTMSPLVMKTCYHFAKLGYEVELWIPRRFNTSKSKDPFEYHKIPEKNFKIKRIPVIDLMFIGSLGFVIMILSYSFSVLLRYLGSKEQQAIFYAHDIRDAFFLSFLSKNIFLEIHDFYLSKIGLFNRALVKAKGIVVTNKIKIEKISKKYNIPRTRMLHKPNAVDIKQFDISLSRLEARNKLELPVDKKIILYTGHLFSWKGVDTLLESHKFLNDDEAIYFVGGASDDLVSFKNKKEELMAGNVNIIGMRPHEEIPLWLRAADVLVLPNTAKEDASKYETSPVKLFEYMASGTPIVSSDLPSIKNVVDERMVWFFEPDNSQSLGETLHVVLKGGDMIENKAKIAKSTVKDYTWETRIGDILRFINEILHEKI